MSNQLISQIRSSLSGRNEAIKTLYLDTDLKKAVVGTLCKMGCQQDKAEDFFTDSIVSFVKRSYTKEFVIKSSLTNYLIGTAKNIWLKEVTNDRKKETIYATLTQEDIQYSVEDNIISKERKRLLYDLLEELGQKCKQVLTLWSINKRMSDIASSLSYRSEGMARKKKHQCLKRLYMIIDQNPHIIEQLRQVT